MPGPGKYKDHSKAAKDVKLGAVDQFKVTNKTTASNKTVIETSQVLKHGSKTPLTKLSLKFKKCDGLRLDSFEASTNGSIKAVVGASNVAPGVDVSVGLDRAFDDKKNAFKPDSAYVSGTYNRDILCMTGKIDALGKSLDVDALVGYQKFLVGFKAGFSQEQSFKGCSGVLGFNWANANRVTLEASNDKKFNFGTFMKPVGGVEVSLCGNGAITSAPAPAAKDEGATKSDAEAKTVTNVDLDAKLAAKFALGNGSSLTTVVSAKPLDINSKFHVGLSYSQNLRNYASLKLSGEVGVTDTEYVGFGAELEFGDL
eukprot:g857.t1